MRRILILLAPVLLGPTVVSGQAVQPLPDGITQAMVAEGESLFGSTGICFACHGQDAKGMPGVGVNLTDEEWLHNEGTFEEIVTIILEGVASDRSRSGAIMPPKGGSQLTEEQVRRVAAYVWSISRGSASSGPLSKGTQTLTNW